MAKPTPLETSLRIKENILCHSKSINSAKTNLTKTGLER